MMKHLIKIFSLTGLVLICPFTMLTASADDEDDVEISEATDEYVFSMKDGHPIVKNKETVEYRALTDRPVTIYPGALYGEFISLDNSYGKGRAQYRIVTPENVFYDDTKVCYYSVYLARKNKTEEVRFQRTFKDVRYFTRVMLAEPYRVRRKTVVFRIPQTMSRFRLHERNFTPHIQISRRAEGSDSVFTYTITDLDRTHSDASQPTSERIYPHILITGSFDDYKDMYKWSNSLTRCDRSIPEQDAILKEINAGCKTDLDRIRATYEWVQKNIRYVAFEAGITGHQPDRPAEVVRKRYGDCKGMSLLLATLLQAQHFDARLVDIGTDDVAFNMSDIPTLAATNHMICVLFHGGKNYWLDATCRYIPVGYVPGAIQGRQAVVEDGENCKLMTLPTLDAHTSTDSLTYHYRLASAGNGEFMLKGTVTDAWCGDMKEWYMRTHEKAETKDKAVMLANTMNNDDHTLNITHARWTCDDRKTRWASAEAEVENRISVQELDGDVYIEMNPHNELFSNRIDTTRRVNDYMLPVRCNIIREVTLTVPAGYKVQCPKNFRLQLPQGIFSCTFTHKNGKITFRRVMQITDRLIPRSKMVAWNDALRRWNDACNEQIILTKK